MRVILIMTLGTLFTGFKRLGKKKQKLEWTEEKTKREMQKPLWLEINKKEFTTIKIIMILKLS